MRACRWCRVSPRWAPFSSRGWLPQPFRRGQVRAQRGDLPTGHQDLLLVPIGDPRADVGFQCLHGFVGAAADHLVGQEAEPAFHLVDPGRAGRGEVPRNHALGASVPPGVPLRPSHRRCVQLQAHVHRDPTSTRSSSVTAGPATARWWPAAGKPSSGGRACTRSRPSSPTGGDATCGCTGTAPTAARRTAGAPTTAASDQFDLATVYRTASRAAQVRPARPVVRHRRSVHRSRSRRAGNDCQMPPGETHLRRVDRDPLVLVSLAVLAPNGSRVAASVSRGWSASPCVLRGGR